MAAVRNHSDVALRVVEAVREDVPQLARLDTLVFGRDAYTELIWRQVLDLAGPLAAVATTATRATIAGFAVVGPEWRRGTGWLMGLAVDPDFRHRGIGAILTEHVIGRALEHGITRILLTVDPENPAVRLYRRIGFCTESSDPNYYGPGRARLVMRLDLGAAR